MTRDDRNRATRAAFAEIGILIESILVWNGTGEARAAKRLIAQSGADPGLDLVVYRCIANANLPLFTDEQDSAEGQGS